MAIDVIRVLGELTLPSETIRLWDGSGGPFTDRNGNIWRPCVLTDEALDQIELAVNSEAATISFVLSGLDEKSSASIWADYKAGEIIGSRFRILLQDCDEKDQPVGSPSVKFTGRLDNISFEDSAGEKGIRSTILVEITNRFALVATRNGSVLSDADQKARAAVLNPSAPPDRFCERIPGLVDKSIRWPNW